MAFDSNYPRYTKEKCPACGKDTAVREDAYRKTLDCIACGFKQRDDKLAWLAPSFQYQYHYSNGLNSMMPLGVGNPPAPKDLPEESIICATGGLVGYRKWNAGMFSSKIQSIRGTVWEPYAKLEAKCEKSVCCGATCDCGIYSWKEVSKLYPPTAPSMADPAGMLCDDFDKLKQVKGSVWMWGRVLQCELGYRAQFCYPKEIFDTGILAKSVASAYGVKLMPEPEKPKVEQKQEEPPRTAAGSSLEIYQPCGYDWATGQFKYF